MFGILIEQECRVLCNNQAVVKSGNTPYVQLAKKHNPTAFHCIHEYVASKMVLLHHKKGESYLADVLTKVLLASKTKSHFTKG